MDSLGLQAIRALALTAALALWTCLLVGCGSKAAPVVELPPPEVTVSQPVAKKVTDYADFTGRLSAVQTVDVRARVSGYLVKIGFDDGQEVKTGDLLFQIDSRPYEAAVELAKAEVAKCEAALAKAKADVARSEELLPNRAISRSEYDLHVAQRGVAEASLQGAKASLQDAELNLEFTRITSPIDGRASRSKFTVGNLIQGGATLTEPLTTIVSTQPIYVEFDLDERTLLDAMRSVGAAKKDTRPDHLKDLKYPVYVGLANEQGNPHAATLDFADNRLDKSTGTIRVRAVLDNQERHFVPGMFVRVRLPLGEPRDALLISERAVGIDQGQKYVLVVDGQNEAHYRAVQLGAVHDGLRVVAAGLQAGEPIVVNGIQRVRPGAKVKPQAGEMPRLITVQGR
jgi:RND family efflux transporter MFP subunit